MSVYNKYARQLQNRANETFAYYIDSKNNVEQADEEYKTACREEQEYLIKHGNSRYDTDFLKLQRKHIRANEKKIDAENEFHLAKVALEGMNFNDIREELLEAIRQNNEVDPSKIDEKTMAVLNSGIVKPEEYRILFDRFKAENNTTMMRLIGKQADEYYKTHASNADGIPTIATVLDELNSMESDPVNSFDDIADAYRRAIRNPAIIPYLNGICEQAIEDF